MSMWAFTASWFTQTSLFLLLNLMIGTVVIISRFGASKKPQHRLGSDNLAPLARAPSLIDRVKSINFLNFKFPQYNPDTDFLQHSEPEYTSPVDPPQLARAPSLLDRFKSINFSNYKFPQYSPETGFLQPSEPEYNNPVDPPQLARAPSLLERVKSINFSSLYRSEQLNAETEFLHNIESSEFNPNPSPSSDWGRVTEHKPKRSKSETENAAAKAPGKMKKSASERTMMGHTGEEEPEIVERRRPATSRFERDGDHGVDAKADDFINRFKQQLKLQRLDSILRYKVGK